MHYLIKNLFKKRGIEDVSQLKEDEKYEYDRWESVLSKPQVSLSDVIEFCKNQKITIENQWRNLDNDSRKNDRLILLHGVYSRILEAITGRQDERKAVERELNELLTK